ncbi:uncharacterized protein LOC132702524 [Cylas formicarius]|uniref:uncharacterized protein LOC132702524 n=1 Tax=Cylas formicarius TaxID=197179 RepID=UPI00295871DB|nr:uncharacterized protein LOC132702524 [Cylas formicarius]
MPLRLLVLLVAFLCLAVAKHRVRRKVLFTKSSKFFFRLNGKDNMLNYTDIWAHGWGFRINYDLPHTVPKRNQFFRRDVHSDIANLDDPVLAGALSCALRPFCEMLTGHRGEGDNCGVLCGIASLIERTRGTEAAFFRSFADGCRAERTACHDVGNEGREGAQ